MSAHRSSVHVLAPLRRLHRFSDDSPRIRILGETYRWKRRRYTPEMYRDRRISRRSTRRSTRLVSRKTVVYVAACFDAAGAVSVFLREFSENRVSRRITRFSERPPRAPGVDPHPTNAGLSRKTSLPHCKTASTGPMTLPAIWGGQTDSRRNSPRIQILGEFLREHDVKKFRTRPS